MAGYSVENALRFAENKAAVLAYLTEVAAVVDQPMDRNVMNGIGDICDDIARWQRRIRNTLDAHTLDLDLTRRKRATQVDVTIPSPPPRKRRAGRARGKLGL